MAQLENIPRSMHRDVIHSYWTMMMELMSQADNQEDTVLKVQVEGYFRQWNRMTGSNDKPKWMTRDNDRKHRNSD